MITGVVNSYLEPTTRLQLKGSKGQIQEVETVIDTGFNGFLTLPPTLIQTLQLTPIGSGRTILGNGTQDLYLIYEATVLWDQRWLIVEADGANTDILIGMGLLSGYNLHVESVALKKSNFVPTPNLSSCFFISSLLTHDRHRAIW